MLTSTVKGFQRFDEITRDIEALSLAALNEAAQVAAEAAQASAQIPLEIEVVPARVGVEAVTAGIVSRKEGRREQVRIAAFFDEGTLTNHRGVRKRPGKKTWKVTRGGKSYQAARHELAAGQGIPAERFFARARLAGRKALLARIDRGAAAVSFFGR